MDHFFSLLINMGLGMIPVLIIMIILSMIALIACWRNEDRKIIGKIAWTIFIILSWPLFAFGAAVPTAPSQSSDLNQPPAPTFSLSVVGDIITAQQIPVEGVGAPGATITILDSGVKVETFTAKPNGIFSGWVALPFGKHSLSALQMINGRTSSASTAVSVTLAPPSIPFLTNVLATSPTTTGISGLGAPGAVITVFDAGNAIGTTTANPDGIFHLEASLGNGNHSITVSQIVDGRTSSASNATKFTLPFPPP